MCNFFGKIKKHNFMLIVINYKPGKMHKLKIIFTTARKTDQTEEIHLKEISRPSTKQLCRTQIFGSRMA